MVLYFAIRIGKALLGSLPKIQHESKISLDIVELELEVIGVRILAFGKFRNLIHRPWQLHPLHWQQAQLQ